MDFVTIKCKGRSPKNVSTDTYPTSSIVYHAIVRVIELLYNSNK